MMRRRKRRLLSKKIETSAFGSGFLKTVLLLERMWIYQETLNRMYEVIKRQAKGFPRLDYCSKEQLQVMWDDLLWKRAKLEELMDWHGLEDGEIAGIERSIDKIDTELEAIDYEWSRFPEPCDPEYSLEAGFHD